jgi:UDP-galactopyranose mutase
VRKTCIVIGAGITGVTAAWHLRQLGWEPVIYEAASVPGGQLIAVEDRGSWAEPEGPHVFHTDNETAYRIVKEFGHLNGYQHRVKTTMPDGETVTWPLQVGELEKRPEWPRIKAELAGLPPKPDGDNFEDYAVSLMGSTLYDLFCYGYTRKQWGCEPRLLSASFAPKRIHLRTDGDTRMFRDKHQGWNTGGWQALVKNLLKASRADVYYKEKVTAASLPAADAYIITAPLDEFLGETELPWRGVETKLYYSEATQPGFLPAAVVNQPSPDIPYTRRVETNQMAMPSGDWPLSHTGTIIAMEYPGIDGVKHYPVDDAAGENRARHREMVRKIKKELPIAYLAGRLANYLYIDVDAALLQGLHAAQNVVRNGK